MGGWQGRLRCLVAANTQLANGLRRVVAQLRAALVYADPRQGATITMQTMMFGDGRVNQAGCDLHVTTGEWLMGHSGEQPPELPRPQPAEIPVRLEAQASGDAHVNQAGRDLHLHYQDDVRRARRVESGTQTGECPYPGLASFGREQARWFFGRDELTSESIARLDERPRPPGGLRRHLPDILDRPRRSNTRGILT